MKKQLLKDWPYIAIILMQLFLQVVIWKMLQTSRANEVEMSRRISEMVKGSPN